MGSSETLAALIFHSSKMHVSCFAFSSVSFIKVFVFVVYGSCTSLTEFIPKYFVGFDAVVRLCSLFLFPERLQLPVRTNTTDFRVGFVCCQFTAFVDYSDSLLVESLGFSLCNIMSSANKANLHLFQSRCPLLLLFLTKIALGGPSRTAVTRSGRSGQSCC